MKSYSSTRACQEHSASTQTTNLGPVAQLFVLLPCLPTTLEDSVDFDLADEKILREIADAADTTARMVHLGTGAIGQLIAHAAPELEDGSIGSDAVEALGWLLAGLGELGAQSAVLALRCRRAASRRKSGESRQHCRKPDQEPNGTVQQ